MRRKRKRDGNYLDLLDYLAGIGCSVLEIAEYALRRTGAPDLLIGWGGRYMLLLEVKDPEGRNRVEPHQIEWHARWRGTPVVVVRSASEILAAMQAVEARGCD